MPYIIKKVKEDGQTGYKVCKRDEPSRCFSKHGMTEKKAKKQRTAIIMSEMGISRKTGGAGEGPKLTTINEIKAYLNEQGYADRVFDLLTKKPKKKDWEELLEEVVKEMEKMPMMPVETIEKNTESNLAKDTTEAFQRLGLLEKKPSKSRKSSPSST